MRKTYNAKAHDTNENDPRENVTSAVTTSANQNSVGTTLAHAEIVAELEATLNDDKAETWRATKLPLSTVRTRYDLDVKNAALSWSDFVANVFADGHPEGDKDGPALVGYSALNEKGVRGKTSKENRSARVERNMKESGYVVYDVETGQTLDEALDALERRGIAAVGWDTHSSGITQAAVTETDLRRFISKSPKWNGREGVLLTNDATDRNELIGDYFREEEGYRKAFTDAMTGSERVHDVSRYGMKKPGVGYVIQHPPMERWRVVIPRAEVFTLIGDAVFQDDQIKEHRARYLGFANDVGLEIDTTGQDPSRLMYFPRRPKGSDPLNFRIREIKGRPLAVEDMPRLSELKRDGAPEAFDRAARELRAGKGKAQDRLKTPRLAELAARDKDQTFRILDFMRDKCPERIVNDTGSDKEQINSPASDLHNDGAGFDPAQPGAFAQQGPDGWNLYDSHNSGSNKYARPDGKHDKLLMLDDLLQLLSVEDAVEELEDYADLEPPRDDVGTALEAFNREGYAVVNMGGDALILHAPWDKNEHPVFGTPCALHTLFANRKVQVEDSMVPVTRLWMAWVGRKTYYHTAMRPYGLSSPDPMSEAEFNLFRGWMIDPQPGDCSKFLWHVEHIVCGGDRQKFEWLVSWCADLVKFPQFKKGTVLVLRGKKGCGKTTLLLALMGLLHPANRIMLDKPDQLVGRFNGHIASSVLIGSEEAFFAGDKRVDGALKNLITSTEVAVERKGVNIFMVENHVHIVMCTNEDWAVPATEDERRYFVLDVADTYAEDAKNPETAGYFNVLYTETVPGPENPKPPGLAAFAQYLLDWQKPDWVDLRRPPMTEGLRDQIAHGLSRHVKWMQEVLERDNGLTVEDRTMRIAHEVTGAARETTRGLLSFGGGSEHGSNNIVQDVLEIGGVHLRNVCVVDDVYDHFLDYAQKKGDRFPANRKTFGRMLARLGFERKRSRVDGAKVSFYVLPPKAEIAAAFEKVYRVKLDCMSDEDGEA